MATSISGNSIAGWFQEGGERETKAFLYKNGNMVDLNDLIAPNSGWVLTEASAVKDAGQMVGYGFYKGVVRAFIATPK